MTEFYSFDQMMKEMKKEKENKKSRKSRSAEKNSPDNSDTIEEDINLHCEDLTIRQLEFILVIVNFFSF